MANVLGSLQVMLRADTAQFTTGMSAARKEAAKSGREIGESFDHLGAIMSKVLGPLGELGSRIAEAFSQVGEAAAKARASAGIMSAVVSGAAAGVVGFGAAMMGAAVHAAEVGNNIFEMREKTGLATTTLQGLMAISKETGGSFEELSVGLSRAEANLAKASLGGANASKVLLDVMGGAKGAAELGLKPMDDRLQAVLKRIFDLNDVGQRNLALTALMGKGWQNNVETLHAFAESADRGAAAAHRLGLDMDPDQAHEFVLQMHLLKAELDGVSLSIGSKLVPAFADAMAGLNVWSEAWGHAGNELVDIGKIVVDLASRDIPGATVAMEDFSAQKAAIQASLKGATDAARQTAEAVAGEGSALDQATPKMKAHADALERAAKASHDFWSQVNAGVEQAKTTFPVLFDIMKATAAQMDKNAAASEKAAEAQSVALATGNLAGAGVKMPTAAPGMDPFGPMSESAKAIPPVLAMMNDEATHFFDLIKQVPGTVTVKVDELRTSFRDFFTELRDQGNQFTTQTIVAMETALNDLSGELSRLAVTGRASFKQIATGFEESVIKGGIDKVIGGAAGKLGTAIFGKQAMNKQLGDSPGNPIYTYDVTSQGAGPGTASPAGGLLGKLFHTSSSSGGDGGEEGGGAAASGGTPSAIGSFADWLSGAIGRQHGGSVTPGRAYIVGERHPEFFIPKQPGEVRPELGGTTHQTVLNFHVNGVSDFDSFKRSQSQIMSGLQNQLATAYARQR